MLKQLLVIIAISSLVSCNEFEDMTVAQLLGGHVSINVEFEIDMVGVNPTHYGNPSGGCMDDEMAGQIQGVNGTACFPKCTGLVIKDKCPTDTPDGDTAPGECVVKDQSSGNKYCVLVCKGMATGDCPTGATCQPIQGQGICLYP